MSKQTSMSRQTNLSVALNILLAAAILPASVYVTLRYLDPVIVVRNVDYFQFIELAQGLGSGSLQSWVNGRHPNGYPLLIRWGLAAGLNAVQIGHLLSVGGGVLLLLSAYLLAYRLTHNRWLALFSEAFLATTGYFLYFATWEGSDMLSAGLQGLTVALLAGLPHRKKTYLTAGLLVGLAYVIRYTAIVTVGLGVVFLAGRALIHRRRAAWIVTGLFVIGFLLGGALQLIPSTLVTGNPFYATQGRNVWWHMEGLSNFATDWNQISADTSPMRIILSNPSRFIQHWWHTACEFWLSPQMLLLDVPLRLLSQAALLFTLLAGKEIPIRKRFFLAFYILGFLAALAVIRYDPRFMIPLLPILVFCTLYFIWNILPERVKVKGFAIPLGTLTLTGLLFTSTGTLEHYVKNRAGFDSDLITVAHVLRAAGMQSASEVLSSAIPFHDVSVPNRTRYPQSYWVMPEMNSLEQLYALAQERGYQFILYDADTGRKAHAGLEELLNPYSRPSGLTPLLVPEDQRYALYRIEPPTPRPSHPIEAQLENGIRLTGYDLYVTQEQKIENVPPRVGLFLYWQATQPISHSYKIFVHIMDADNQLIAQHDSLPALWTFPTDRWPTGETVIDFHSLTLPPEGCPDTCNIRVGMYSVETAQRLTVVDKTGHPIDDKLTLGNLP